MSVMAIQVPPPPTSQPSSLNHYTPVRYFFCPLYNCLELTSGPETHWCSSGFPALPAPVTPVTSKLILGESFLKRAKKNKNQLKNQKGGEQNERGKRRAGGREKESGSVRGSGRTPRRSPGQTAEGKLVLQPQAGRRAPPGPGLWRGACQGRRCCSCFWWPAWPAPHRWRARSLPKCLAASPSLLSSTRAPSAARLASTGASASGTPPASAPRATRASAASTVGNPEARQPPPPLPRTLRSGG